MKLLIARVADKEYGISIDAVMEVVRPKKTIPIPDSPDYIEGVSSIRGKVIPIVNMRAKLGMRKDQSTQSQRIIITKTGEHAVGMVVDSVSEVITANDEDITPPDDIWKQAAYLIAVARVSKRIILIIDIEKLLSAEAGNDIKKIHDMVEIRKKGA